MQQNCSYDEFFKPGIDMPVVTLMLQYSTVHNNPKSTDFNSALGERVMKKERERARVRVKEIES